MVVSVEHFSSIALNANDKHLHCITIRIIYELYKITFWIITQNENSLKSPWLIQLNHSFAWSLYSPWKICVVWRMRNQKMIAEYNIYTQHTHREIIMGSYEYMRSIWYTRQMNQLLQAHFFHKHLMK